MEGNGLLVRLRVLVTNETVFPKHLGEALGQNPSAQTDNHDGALVGTLVLQNHLPIRGDTSQFQDLIQHFAHGLWLIPSGNGQSPQLPAQTLPILNLDETESKEKGAVSAVELKQDPTKSLDYFTVKSARKVILLKLDDID